MAAFPARILVTGANGFVGRHLLPALATAFPSARLLSAFFDVTDPEETLKAVREGAPEACVHLAGIASPRRAQCDPDRAWQVNLHGTLALAHAIRLTAPECVLLFASSGDAYGESFRANRPVTEDTPLAPLNTYSATKAAADLALGALSAEGLRAVRLRPFNHIGPGQSSDFAVAAFAYQIARILAGLQPPVLKVGALDPQRDFLDVRDVCAAYVTSLQRSNALQPGTILNIASGIARRVGDVLMSLMAIAGLEAEIESEPTLLRSAEIPLAWGDATRARELLDWRPQIPWERTLSDTLNDWCARVMAEPRAERR